MWELVSSPTRQVTAQEEMASSFARGSIGWILGKSSALQGWVKHRYWLPWEVVDYLK